ncbi:RusA family crossover junction endodeoxyribonuclease [Leptospira mtsangambouensis]|uniref:RusA family crossover junction endodeoxyribonuclease n=1 Tax=Leptospira mtsangambouensis TaxID=2484912 RepID=UPI001EE9F5F4|nr:RusA family crossover junction endodeoxyribonuclease [Leptospira mtsangambouensis]MCG6140654.1 RusA family crossover junction endodeoxyribonuclease [Leptospira mtsangambouensis]
MLPFEFIIQGCPVSHQTRNRQRLRAWKTEVGNAAKRNLNNGFSIIDVDIIVTITFYHDGPTPDVDNIIKPIQDALIGIVYTDDKQVVETKSRKKSINSSYKIRGVSEVLLSGFATGNDFLHVKISEAIHSEILD